MEFGGQIYDPSYGFPPLNSRLEWENMALEGFGLYGAFPISDIPNSDVKNYWDNKGYFYYYLLNDQDTSTEECNYQTLYYN